MAMRSSEFQNELVYSDSTPEANMSIIPHIHTRTHAKKEKSSTEKDKQSHLVELVEKNQMNKVLVSIL